MLFLKIKGEDFMNTVTLEVIHFRHSHLFFRKIVKIMVFLLMAAITINGP